MRHEHRGSEEIASGWGSWRPRPDADGCVLSVYFSPIFKVIRTQHLSHTLSVWHTCAHTRTCTCTQPDRPLHTHRRDITGKTHPDTHMHTHAHTYAHTVAYIHTSTHVRAHRVAYIHTYTHEHTQTHKRTCAHSNVYTNTHTQTRTIAHAQTHTHTR